MDALDTTTAQTQATTPIEPQNTPPIHVAQALVQNDDEILLQISQVSATAARDALHNDQLPSQPVVSETEAVKLPSVNSLISPKISNSVKSLSPAHRLQTIFTEVLEGNTLWSQRLASLHFTNLPQWKAAVKGDRSLARCLEQCTATGNWKPLFKHGRYCSLAHPRIHLCTSWLVLYLSTFIHPCNGFPLLSPYHPIRFRFTNNLPKRLYNRLLHNKRIHHFILKMLKVRWILHSIHYFFMVYDSNTEISLS
jgi:hypothetical protein